jgi:hypothetical protein
MLLQATRLTNTAKTEEGENYWIKEKLNGVVAFSNIGRRLYQARLFQHLPESNIAPLYLHKSPL